jgi:hypothetical protein
VELIIERFFKFKKYVILKIEKAAFELSEAAFS